MCLHETLQISQDGENVIYCPDCSREVAKFQSDDDETLVVPVARGKHVVLVDGELGDGQGVVITNKDGHFQVTPTYPCARCGWSASCPKYEDEPCHT